MIIQKTIWTALLVSASCLSLWASTPEATDSELALSSVVCIIKPVTERESLSADQLKDIATTGSRILSLTNNSLQPVNAALTIDLARSEAHAFLIEIVRIHAPMPIDSQETNVQPLSINVPTVSADGIRFYQVLDVQYKGPKEHPAFSVPAGGEGYIPDICVPVSDGQRLTAQTHSPNRILVLADVLATAPAGDYRLTIPDETARPPVIDLRIVRHSAKVPVRLDVVTGVTWNWGIEKYLGRKLDADERLRFIDFFLDYRLTPASFFSQGVQFSDEELKRIVQRGGNLFQVYHVGGGGARLLNDKQMERARVELTAIRERMQAAGALNDCYALIGDEPKPDAFPTIRQNAEFLQSVFPEIKIWLGTRPHSELTDIVNVWDPIIAHSTDYYALHSYTPESHTLAKASDKKPQVWWFYSVEPYAPYPNCRIENSLTGSRSIGWLSFINGLDGFEYFWATDWEMNAPLATIAYPEKAERWDVGLSGAGQLCYPMETGGQCVPIPSLRLVCLREAMEDWAIFRLAGSDAVRSIIEPADDSTIPSGVLSTDVFEAMRMKALTVLDAR
ncbi:MAG: glycoside hydrolase domain-containing protein [Planctomycetota bacterium]